MTFAIEVENKFKRGKRGIIVYDSSQEQDLIIPWKEGLQGVPKAGFKLLAGSSKDEDYLVVAVAPGGGDLERCRIGIPANIPFTFIPGGVGSITVIPAGKKIFIRIPEGPPTWQLKIRRPPDTIEQALGDGTNPPDSSGNVTVGDDGPGGLI